MSFEFSGLSVRLSELTTLRPSDCCYCTPLLRYTAPFVKAQATLTVSLYMYANSPFCRSDKHLTKVHHLRHGFIFRPELPVDEQLGFRFKHTQSHKVMFVFVITHHTAGNFLSCKEFPLSCLNAKGKKLQRTCLVMMSYDMYHDSKNILKKKVWIESEHWKSSRELCLCHCSDWSRYEQQWKKVFTSCTHLQGT